MPSLKIDTASVYRTLHGLEADGEVQSAWDTTNVVRPPQGLLPDDSGMGEAGIVEGGYEPRLTILQHFVSTYEQVIRSRPEEKLE